MRGPKTSLYDAWSIEAVDLISWVLEIQLYLGPIVPEVLLVHAPGDARGVSNCLSGN